MCCCAKTKSAKIKACGIASVATGGLLLALGISWPFIMDSLIMMGAKESTALTPDSYSKWASVPG